jgi:rubredoxin---NAD+ reductase
MDGAIVVVGSGLAGYTLAREFRKLDKQAPLVIVSRDAAGFYSKPMLSNALASKKAPEALVMKAADKMAVELGATVRAHTQVEGIDAQRQALRLIGGEVLPYRDLVLALGADPIRLPLAGDGASAVLSVNDLDDYAAFARQIEGVKSVVILGAGLIGCEFANDLLSRGITPTLIDPAERALSRLLPEQASAMLQQRLQAAGAQFKLGASAQRIDRVGAQFKLALSDGSSLVADVVLSAIGLRPRVALAAEAGLSVNRGIVCDRALGTSAAHIHALGDCAEVLGHNLPYVMPIMQLARALAATLAGQPTPVVYPAMPVVVKTPACPTVVCPPPPDVAGAWQVERTDEACEARFVGDDGRVRGFALMGTAVAQRQALVTQVPALVG